MLPLRLFASRGFAAAGATGFLVNAALIGTVFLASQYFQFALGFSPLATGLRFLPWTATPMLVAPAAGLLSDRIGQRTVMVVGMLLQGLGFVWFALVATTGVDYSQLVVPLLIAVTIATVVSRVLGAPSIYSARLGGSGEGEGEGDSDGDGDGDGDSEALGEPAGRRT